MPDEILRKPSGANVRLGTFVLLVILVAIAFGGAGYLYGINAGKTITSATKTATATVSATTSKTISASTTSTINATADWKTYTNEKYGFSFKYPKDWMAKEGNVSEGDLALAKISFSRDKYFSMQVVDLNKFASSIQNGTFTDRTLLGYVKYSQSKEGLTETVVNGNSVVKMKITNLDDANGYSAGFFLLKDDKIYEVHANYPKSDDTSGNILDLILSTFQFTK